jgi:hypothetical protein
MDVIRRRRVEAFGVDLAAHEGANMLVVRLDLPWVRIQPKGKYMSTERGVVLASDRQRLHIVGGLD